MAKKITGFHDLWVNSLLIGDAAIELSGTELAKLDGVTGTIAETDGTQTLTNKTLLAVDGSAAAPSIGFTSDTDNGLYRSATNLWHLVGGGAAILSVEGVNGRIGVGTTEPHNKLHVKGPDTTAIHVEGASTGYVNAAIVLRSTVDVNGRGSGVFMHDLGGATEWYAGRPYGDSDTYIVARQASVASHDGGSTAQTSNAHFAVTSSGNVGIGTTSPGCKLDVDGVIRPKTYTVATLPTIVTGGMLYASDGRKAGEGAASGTGVLVFADGSNWIAVDTGATVAA